MIVAVDFDGTLCENIYPKIGKPNCNLIAELKDRQAKGDTIILWTCREGELLSQSIEWLKKQGITFDYVNANDKKSIKKFKNDCRKVYANEYIDDKATRISFSNDNEKTKREETTMPLCKDREYRAVSLPLMVVERNKRFDSGYYAEGYATTFDTPYMLYEYEGIKVYEVIDRNALAGADLSDVIMQYDHTGKVLARLSNNTLGMEATEKGLFIFADLSKSAEARNMYEEITNELVTKMSWAFTVAEERYNKDTHTRTILKIKKVYDVSAVSIPANDGTNISARSFAQRSIAAEQQELLERRAAILKIRILLED